jgi:tape measure domain-containing protein
VVTGLWSAAQQGQNLNIAFRSVAGSAEGAREELNFIRSTSRQLKLEFYSTAEAYKGIYAAAKDTALKDEIQDIFLAAAEASAALRLSQDETNGVLRAFSQIISKGKVQAEELRGQIGERLPGAFQLAASAMGVTTQELDKMLENGEVMAEDMLPALARALHDKYGDAARAAAADTENMAGAANSFSTAWKDLLYQIGKSGFVEVATRHLNRLTETLRDPATRESVKELSAMLFNFLDLLLTAIARYGKFIAGFAATAVAVKILKSLVNTVSALNAGFKAMAGTGIVSFLWSYARAAQAASVQSGVLRAAVSSVATALTTATASLSAFIGGWQLGRVIGEIDIVERAVQGMYATIDEWFTKAQIKYLELKRAWNKLWGDGDDVAALDRRIDALNRHLDVIDRTREKIRAIDDSDKKSARSAEENAKRRIQAAMEEARAEVEAEQKKQAANQETAEQEKDIYREKQARIRGRVEDLSLALDEEIAAIDLAEAQKRITEEQARKKRIQAQREFIQQKLSLVREELEQSVSAQAEETEKKAAYERDLKKEIREMEIELTKLRVKELSAQTEVVKEADKEQEKSAREKYQERISMIREETEAQRDELAKQLAYIDDLEQEGVISHQEAVDRKIQAEMEFARAKVEQTEKAARAAAEIYGKDSAEYQIAVNKQKKAAEELADKRIESAKRAKEARKALEKTFGAWLVDYTRQTVAESARTYSEFMATMQTQLENVNQFIYGESMAQQSRLAGAVQKVRDAFQGTAEAVERAYGVSLDYENMTFEELRDAVATVREMFAGLRDDLQAGRSDIEAIGQGISDWQGSISGVGVSLRDFSEQTQAFRSAWADLWEGGPRPIDDTKAAIDRVKAAYSEMVQGGEAALNELMEKWDSLESRIQSVEEQIKGLYADTADTIRELNRDLMSSEDAWLDERLQAQETYNQAVQEMNRGNVELANELFTEARSLARGLAREVTDESGEVVRSLDDTTEAAVDLIRKITEAQGGNLRGLKSTLEDQQAGIRDQIGRTHDALSSTAGKMDEINKRLKLSAEEIKKITESLPADWFGSGSKKHQYAAGGLTVGPRHSAGGMDVNVEGGEFIEPRPAVKKYGAMVFEAFRQLKIDKEQVDWLLSGGRQVMGAGGLVHRSIQAAAPRIAMPAVQPRLVFESGGQVQAGAAPAVEKVHRVKFDFGKGKTFEGDFAPDQAQGVIRALKAAKLRSN